MLVVTFCNWNDQGECVGGGKIGSTSPREIDEVIRDKRKIGGQVALGFQTIRCVL